MTSKTGLKDKILSDLSKAKGHLEYSYKKVSKLSFSKEWDEEELETLESFSSRFARFSDLVISRYFRILAREKDPGFNGPVIDLLNLAEKFSWIKSQKTWMRIREIRNIAAHEYTAEDYKKLYKEVFDLTPDVLSISLSL